MTIDEAISAGIISEQDIRSDGGKNPDSEKNKFRAIIENLKKQGIAPETLKICKCNGDDYFYILQGDMGCYAHTEYDVEDDKYIPYGSEWYKDISKIKVTFGKEITDIGNDSFTDALCKVP